MFISRLLFFSNAQVRCKHERKPIKSNVRWQSSVERQKWMNTLCKWWQACWKSLKTSPKCKHWKSIMQVRRFLHLDSKIWVTFPCIHSRVNLFSFKCKLKIICFNYLEENRKRKKDDDELKAIDMRKKAMESLGETPKRVKEADDVPEENRVVKRQRSAGSETVQFLKEKKMRKSWKWDKVSWSYKERYRGTRKKDMML